MNNKLLYLNMDNIKQLILLDEACDTPEYANWNPNVDCGEYPPVIYEALDDYFYYDEVDDTDDLMSPQFYEMLKTLVEQKEWDEDYILKLNDLVQHYSDGRVISSSCIFDKYSSLLTEIDLVYSFEDDAFAKDWLSYTNMSEEEILINMKQISFLELPLLEAEKEMWRVRKEEEE